MKVSVHIEEYDDTKETKSDSFSIYIKYWFCSYEMSQSKESQRIIFLLFIFFLIVLYKKI
jgi:hypothetical protein